MANLRLPLAVLCTALLAVPSESAFGQAAADSTEIVVTIENYVDGWWEGDVDKMEAALHPDLVKRNVVSHPETGRSLLNSSTKGAMVEYTRAGGGSSEPDQKGDVEISIDYLDGDIASAMARSAFYIDYLHLVKWNGEWKIVNVLWGLAGE